MDAFRLAFVVEPLEKICNEARLVVHPVAIVPSFEVTSAVPSAVPNAEPKASATEPNVELPTEELAIVLPPVAPALPADWPLDAIVAGITRSNSNALAFYRRIDSTGRQFTAARLAEQLAQQFQLVLTDAELKATFAHFSESIDEAVPFPRFKAVIDSVRQNTKRAELVMKSTIYAEAVDTAAARMLPS